MTTLPRGRGRSCTSTPAARSAQLGLPRRLVVGQSALTSVGVAPQARQVQRDDAGAAVEVLLLQRPQRHHRPFARDAGRVAEVVAVEDVVADHDDALARGTACEQVARCGVVRS